MIPKTEYIFVDGVGHVVTDELVQKYHTPEDVSKFNKWMRGQTSLCMSDGKAGIYSWDYERWLSQGKKTQQGEDWD